MGQPLEDLKICIDYEIIHWTILKKSDRDRILEFDLSKNVIKIWYYYVQKKETKIVLLENNNNMVMSTSTMTD